MALLTKNLFVMRITSYSLITLPYLTTENLVLCLPAKLLATTNNLSEHSLVAPYKLIGLAALSVESAITFFTLFFIAASIIFSAP